jgi:hypothetical protein
MRGNQHHKKGEYIMNKRVVEHKIKLEKSVKIILGVLAFGVFLNAFAPAFDVRKAFAYTSPLYNAELDHRSDRGSPTFPLHIYGR